MANENVQPKGTEQMETHLEIVVDGKYIASTDIPHDDNFTDEQFGRDLRIFIASAQKIARRLAAEQAAREAAAANVSDAQKDNFFATLRAEAEQAAKESEGASE